MITFIRLLLSILPELIELIKTLQSNEKDKKHQAYNNKRVKNDLKKINEAFRSRDANLLNSVFSGGVPDESEKKDERKMGNA